VGDEELGSEEHPDDTPGHSRGDPGSKSITKRFGCIGPLLAAVALVFGGVWFASNSITSDPVESTNSPAVADPEPPPDGVLHDPASQGFLRELPPATESYPITMEFFQMHGGVMPAVVADARWKTLEQIMDAIKWGTPIVTVLRCQGTGPCSLLDLMSIEIEVTDRDGKSVKKTLVAHAMWPGPGGKEIPADAKEACTNDPSNMWAFNEEEPYMCKAEIILYDFPEENDYRLTARTVSDGQIIAEHDLIWDPEFDGWTPREPVVQEP